MSKLHWSTDSCSKTKPSPLPSRSKKIRLVKFLYDLFTVDDSMIFVLIFDVLVYAFLFMFVCLFVFFESVNIFNDSSYFWDLLLSSSIGSFFP